MKTAEEKLTALRAQLKEQGVGGFIVPRADEYQGEFVASYAERLKWLSGFTGSGGIAAVLMDKAIVQTDGRYLLQIEQQVDKNHFETGNMIAEPLAEWLADNADDVIGYDPWLHTPKQIKAYENAGVNLKALDENPLDAVWADQPARPAEPIYDFPKAIAGVGLRQKIKDIGKKLEHDGARAFILSLPDSICWLMNIRGQDISFIPQVLSYAIIYADGRPMQWVVDPARSSEKLLNRLEGAVEFIAPEDLEGALNKLAQENPKVPVMMDFSHTPIWFKQKLETAGGSVAHASDPCIHPKSTKTPSEQEAIKKAHALDAIAMVRFLHWVDTVAGPGRAGELEIGREAGHFRAENPAYKGESFPIICGFGENGAVIHYRATEEKFSYIDGDGLLLIDSGGQYLDEGAGVAGTTDITRTVAIGTPSEEMKRRFTLVLKGHIALAMAKFPQGTTGAQIDTLARAALWNDGLDFAHGTGHGVGCFLAVHEEAANISPRGKTPFSSGMLISNEPGYYKEGEYGIRIENLVLVKQTSEDFEGTGTPVLEFETVSYAPIDRTLIAVEHLSAEERKWLNDYHATLFEMTREYLSTEQCEWLKEKTAPL